MNTFENQLFNPNYVNQDYYRQLQQKNYIDDQNERVMKLAHSFSDMLDQVKGMDDQHQQEAFWLCLVEVARRNEWK